MQKQPNELQFSVGAHLCTGSISQARYREPPGGVAGLEELGKGQVALGDSLGSAWAED